MEMMGSGSWAAVGDDTGLAEDPEPIPNLAQKLIAFLDAGDYSAVTGCILLLIVWSPTSLTI